jgi:hypothetical protein
VTRFLLTDQMLHGKHSGSVSHTHPTCCLTSISSSINTFAIHRITHMSLPHDGDLLAGKEKKEKS